MQGRQISLNMGMGNANKGREVFKGPLISVRVAWWDSDAYAGNQRAA